MIVFVSVSRCTVLAFMNIGTISLQYKRQLFLSINSGIKAEIYKYMPPNKGNKLYYLVIHSTNHAINYAVGILS